MRSEIKNLFAYGSLMCDDIMMEVSGCKLSSLYGTLKGYRRLAVLGEHYPAIIPDGNCCVDGIIYLDLPPAAFERLDRFEGEMYTCNQVSIETDHREILTAATYVFKPEFQNKLDKSEWSFSDFLLKGKEEFRKSYKGYNSI